MPAHSTLPSDSDPNDDMSGTSPRFVSFRLPAHHRKHCPPGYVGLDRVLEEVGCRLHSEGWGRLPGWKLLPFRYEGRRKGYRTAWDLRLVAGEPRLRSKPLITELGRAELHACTRIYRTACNRVIAEFEAGKLTPYALHRPWGHIEKITIPGIWATQSEWAFYAGLVVVTGQSGAMVTARILVRAAELSDWAYQHDHAGLEQWEAEARRRVGRAIRDFMAETTLRPTKEQVRDFCESVMGKGTLKPAAAFADVWDQIPPSQGGRPGDAVKVIAAQREAWLARIGAAWVGVGDAEALG